MAAKTYISSVKFFYRIGRHVDARLDAYRSLISYFGLEFVSKRSIKKNVAISERRRPFFTLHLPDSGLRGVICIQSVVPCSLDKDSLVREGLTDSVFYPLTSQGVLSTELQLI